VDDITTILDRALSRSQKLTFPSSSAAQQWRRRANHVRSRAQKQTRELGIHPWYSLIMRIEGETVLVETFAPLAVEEL